MAPNAKDKASAEPKKQKSLMAFFSKGPAATPGSTTKSAGKPFVAPKPVKRDASQSSVSSSRSQMSPVTPELKRPNIRALNSSAAASSTSSYGGSSVKDTPPTSDLIDVDMMSDEEDRNQRVRVKTVSNRFLFDASLCDLNDMTVEWEAQDYFGGFRRGFGGIWCVFSDKRGIDASSIFAN